MAKKRFDLLVFCIICVIGFQACASTESSVKGTMTTINTLGGDSFEAIVLIKNTWEEVKIAKDDNGSHIMYVNIMTNGNNRPGSVIIYTDGNRHNISNPTDWDIDNVSVSQYGTAKYWSCYKQLDISVIQAILNVSNARIRAVGGNAYMSKDEGVDITKILPALKEFISK